MDYRISDLGSGFDLQRMADYAVRSCRDVVFLSGSKPLDHPIPGPVWSLLAFNPVLLFKAKGAYCEFSHDTSIHRLFGNPWNIFESRFSRFEIYDTPMPGVPVGAAMGYFGYDLKNAVEPGLPQSARDDLELPDAVIGFYPSLLIQQPTPQGELRTWLISTGHDADGHLSSSQLIKSHDQTLAHVDQALRHQQKDWTPDNHQPHRHQAAQVSSTWTRDAFCRAVDEVREWIRIGHIYQVNLSQRLTSRFTPSPHSHDASWNIFRELSHRSQPEFGGFAGFHRHGLSLASASPELFLSMDSSRISTCPIKGTRPRGTNPISDQLLKDELRSSEKECAELTMITDLLRNDIGKISEYGSVTVPEFLSHKSLPQVHHLYSHIQGQLRSGLSHLEALKSCFPGGSVTGAPKIRSMEIIDNIEPVTRGPYTGALGYLGFNQVSQFNILIRTAILENNRIHFPVGAGIVADSDPLMEYDETWHKAQAFIQLIQGEQGIPFSLVPNLD